jgi:membrane fusion protein (multidrug efflux system)
MAVPFSRTLRALEAERRGRCVPALAVLVLLGSWAAWGALARVPLWEVTESARLEVDSAAHPITAVVGGRVVRTKLRLGQEVRAGEVVLVLDAEADRRALQEKQARRRALGERLTALRREIQVERSALRVYQRARHAALEEARAQVVEAEVRATAAAREAERSARLRPSRAVSDEQYRRDRTEADARRAALRALRLAVTRQEQDRTAQETERRVRLARLERDAAELEGDMAVEAAGIRRLEHAIALCSVRAPVAGRVGEVGEYRVGAVVRPAEKLGSIVPPGAARAVAHFPAAVVGRIRPGQPARLRLHGYPWAQYGTLAATVARVGNEPSDGRVRVELTLAAGQDTRIPLEHGSPGSAEVEVERLPPVVLALRAAGQLLRGEQP